MHVKHGHLSKITSKLEACEMWLWRKIERIIWQDHMTNEEV